MGSLMAGWSSHVLESKPDKYKRNRSLTKEEIEAYWKEHKKSDDSTTQELSRVDEAGRTFQKSNSFPIAGTKDTDTETGVRQIIKKNGWWSLSTCAFLNELPISDGSSNTNYASQSHVASWAPKSNDGDQIST